MIASQVVGDTIKMEVGENLNVISLQDTDNYHEEQMNASVSANSSGSVSGSYSEQNIDSEYKSVNDQAGIHAGKGGFDIEVGKNTNLVGGVITSEADSDKNRLSTDTLTYSDIKNKAEYDSSTVGFGGSSSTPDNDKRNQGMGPILGGSSDKETSTTKSGIAEGTLDIRGDQKQDLAGLDRNPDKDHQGLDKIFDKDKILEREQAAGLFGEMAFEAAGKLAKKFGWEPGDPRRAALHGLIGGIMADINGGKFGDGLTTAMINKILIDQLVKSGTLDGTELRWVSGIIGGALNGGQGAGIADSATKNNAVNELRPEGPKDKGKWIRNKDGKYAKIMPDGSADYTQGLPPIGTIIWVEDNSTKIINGNLYGSTVQYQGEGNMDTSFDWLPTSYKDTTLWEYAGSYFEYVYKEETRRITFSGNQEKYWIPGGADVAVESTLDPNYPTLMLRDSEGVPIFKDPKDRVRYLENRASYLEGAIKEQM